MRSSPWRGDFPGILALEAEGQIYLDSAATAQKPHRVLDRLQAYYQQGAANVHRAQHLPAERATCAFEAVRSQLAQWLRAASAEQIIFTKGATEALNLLAYGLEAQFKPGDQIVISALEHHANLLPWQQLAKRKQLELKVLPITEQGAIDYQAAGQLIGPRCRLLAISQLSNVLGRWNPVAELVSLARAQGAWTVVDGAQGAVHQRPNLAELGCDFYVFSAHKLYSVDGLGVLYGRSDALAALAPWQFGGEMLEHCDFYQASFRTAPLGFEAGTPPIGPVLALGAALDYLNQLDLQVVQHHEQELHRYLLEGLKARALPLLGAPECALASFYVPQVHGSDLAQLLAEQGVAVRFGQHCAQPLMQHLGVPGSLRVSLALYNQISDLDYFFNALDKALELLQ